MVSVGSISEHRFLLGVTVYKELLKLKPKHKPKVLKVSPSSKAEFHPPDKKPPCLESHGFLSFTPYFPTVI